MLIQQFKCCHARPTTSAAQVTLKSCCLHRIYHDMVRKCMHVKLADVWYNNSNAVMPALLQLQVTLESSCLHRMCHVRNARMYHCWLTCWHNNPSTVTSALLHLNMSCKEMHACTNSLLTCWYNKSNAVMPALLHLQLRSCWNYVDCTECLM